jgi:hypothetical protein
MSPISLAQRRHRPRVAYEKPAPSQSRVSTRQGWTSEPGIPIIAALLIVGIALRNCASGSPAVCA